MPNQTSDYRFHSHGFDVPRSILNDQKVQTYKGAYISIINQCNTDVCEYCYARAESKKAPMSLETFLVALDWLGSVSDFPEVYFVGGEPSIHPKLILFLDELSRRGWSSTLYTNGAFKNDRCDQLAHHTALRRVAFHFERSFFEKFPRYESHFHYNLRAMGTHKEASLLFVINDENFDYEMPLALAAEYHLALTWVFAAPTASGTRFMTLDAMRKAGPRLQEFLLKADQLRINTAPDLPVPLCVFDPVFLESYSEHFKLRRKCRPFVYLKSDLSAQFCTAMPIFSSPRPTNARGLFNIIQENRLRDSELKKRASFPECVTCSHHLEETCQGGCMTYKVYGNSSSADENLISVGRKK